MEVTASIVFDVADLAGLIDQSLGSLLLPEAEGYYLPFQLDPVMRPGRAYYTNTKTTSTRIETLADITHDVFDHTQSIILTASQVKRLKDHSYPYPARSLKLLRACVEHLISVHGVWGATAKKQREHARSPAYNLQAVIRDFVLPQYEHDPAVLELVEDQLLAFKITLTDFLGTNRWIMHFQKMRGSTFIVEKSIDWRTVIFMQERGLWDAP